MGNTLAPSGQFQLVAVPPQHVAAVYRLLADLEDSAGAVPTSAESTTVGWTDAMLTRFASAPQKTPQMVSEIMDLLSALPEGQRLTLDQLAEKTGRPLTQIKTLWTHAARHLKKHYGVGHPPLTKRWGQDLDPTLEQVVYYYTTPEQAAAWKRVREGAMSL